MTAGIFGAYAALTFNVYNLQIAKGSYYSAKVASQSRGTAYLNAIRGTIFIQDKNNNKIPAVFNRQFPVIFAVPKEIADPTGSAVILAELLGLDAAKLRAQFEKPNDLYELLIDKATDEQVAKIRQQGIKGIYIDSEYFRFYPFAQLASQLFGFVGPGREDATVGGHYGVELYYDESLERSDLDLTIDRNIQFQAEKILRTLAEKHGAESGTVIVQEPKTGKILALGNYPNFDPNNYGDYPIKSFLNPAVQSVYEPGSVFKVLTMSAGIDSGKITPDTTFYDTGSLSLNGRIIKNWDGKAHGKVTMTNVIEQSINTGAAFAERKTGHDIFYNYLLKFGFGDLTGIALPGESGGSLRNLKTSTQEINFATAAFGQGVAVTPIQLVNAISAIANGGSLMKPFIVEGTPPEVLNEAISRDSADQVAAMMVSAVNKAEIARIPGYQIAGKTGTAQIPDFRRGGYSDQYIHSYVGFGPVSDPKFSILMKIDKPKGVGLAGSTVVPAFRELAQFIINYYNIPTDEVSLTRTIE